MLGNFSASYFTSHISTLAKPHRHYRKAYCNSETIRYFINFYLLSKSKFPAVLPAFCKSSFLRLLVGIGITEKIQHIQIVLNEFKKANFTNLINNFFLDLYCSLVVISYCNNFTFIMLKLNLCLCFFKYNKSNVLHKTSNRKQLETNQ